VSQKLAAIYCRPFLERALSQRPKNPKNFFSYSATHARQRRQKPPNSYLFERRFSFLQEFAAPFRNCSPLLKGYLPGFFPVALHETKAETPLKDTFLSFFLCFAMFRFNISL